MRHPCRFDADLDAAVTHLLAEGVAVEDIRVEPHTGRRFTFSRDPDGLPLELYEIGPAEPAV